MQKLTAFIGRILLALIFFISGLHNIFEWEFIKESLVSVLRDWVLYVGGLHHLESFFEMLLDHVPLLLGIGIFSELFGAFLVIFGLRIRFGAFLMLLFLIPATLFYHHFWFLAGQRRELELNMFLRNVSIAGGLLILMAAGKPGQKKEDKPDQNSSTPPYV